MILGSSYQEKMGDIIRASADSIRRKKRGEGEDMSREDVQDAELGTWAGNRLLITPYLTLSKVSVKSRERPWNLADLIDPHGGFMLRSQSVVLAR